MRRQRRRKTSCCCARSATRSSVSAPHRARRAPMTSRSVLLRAACLGMVAGALAPGETRAVTSSAVVGGLASPTDIVNAGDHSGRLFVVEQAGTIRIVAADRLVATPFLDIRSLVLSGGEQGFLGLAFHPQ